MSVEKRLAQAKLEAEYAPERVQRRREIRCFWTWPLGHLWRSSGALSARCVFCHKTHFLGW